MLFTIVDALLRLNLMAACLMADDALFPRSRMIATVIAMVAVTAAQGRTTTMTVERSQRKRRLRLIVVEEVVVVVVERLISLLMD